MLEHKVFAESVSKDIKDYLSPDYADVECEVTEERKNNGQMCVGVSFRQPGKESAPFIRMAPFYEGVRSGKPLKDIMREIAAVAEEGMKIGLPICSDQINQYDKAKEYLGVRLVNTRANKKVLENLTHREIEDLSLIPVIRFPTPEQDGYMSVKVTKRIQKEWGVSTDQIFEQAWDNEELPILQGISGYESCWENGCDLFAMENIDENNQKIMYALRNNRGLDGAALIAFPGVGEKLGELFPKGYFVLPSSIHETLILPKGKEKLNTEITLKVLGQMVRDINQNHVRREEILSDRIYEYDRESGKIRQVPESVKKERGTVER